MRVYHSKRHYHSPKYLQPMSESEQDGEIFFQIHIRVHEEQVEDSLQHLRVLIPTV